MTATLTKASTQTCYEVVFGPDECDRQTYIDYGDGAFVSTHAEVTATRFFFQMSEQRVPCGFWIDGTLAAGEDITAPLAPVEHKTRTSFPTGRETGIYSDRYGWVRDRTSTAYCTCGWVSARDNRDLARAAARQHREEAA